MFARPAGLSTQYAGLVFEALREGSWLRTSAIKSQIRAKLSQRVDVDVPSLVEPVDAFFGLADNYRLLWSRPWRSREEPINIREGGVALSSLRRSSRVRSLMGHTKLTLSDNFPAISAFSKGRSSSFAMNRLCRVAAGVQLATGIVWRLRHIETSRNVADEPSRRFERKHRGVRPAAPSVLPLTCSGGFSAFSRGRKQDVEPGAGFGRRPPLQ